MLHKALVGTTLPTTRPPMVFATSECPRAFKPTCLHNMHPRQRRLTLAGAEVEAEAWQG